MYEDHSLCEEQIIQLANRCLDCKDRPCMVHCPAFLLIPAQMTMLKRGELHEAGEALMATDPFMGLTCRCCTGLCEGHCPLPKEEQIPIRSMEQFLSAWTLEHEEPPASRLPTTVLSVAVIGGGPTGIVCALALAQAGIQVSLFEKTERLGGDWVKDADELEQLPDPARTLFNPDSNPPFAIETGIEIGRDLDLEELCRDHDAVCIATGMEGWDGTLTIGPDGRVSSSIVTGEFGGDVFAAGAAVVGSCSLAAAVGEGKRAAAAIFSALELGD